MKYSVYQNLI